MSGGMVLFFTVHFAHPTTATLPTILDHFSENYIGFCRLSGSGRRAAWRRHFNDGVGAQTWLKGGQWEGVAVSVYPGEGRCNPSARPLTTTSVRIPVFLYQLLSVWFSLDFL